MFGFGQSTPTPAPPPPTKPAPPADGIQNIIGQNLRDDPANRNLVDTTDYMTFDKRNYAPGGKLEINPAALQIGFNQDGTAKGIASFPQTAEQQAFQKRLDAGGPFYGPEQQLAVQAGTVPTKMGVMDKGYFTGQKEYKTPRTIGEQVYASQLSQGDTAKLKQFMEANIEGLPGDLTRQELVDMYNNYNQFLGRSSNYAAARVPGQVSGFLNTLPYVGTIKKGFEKLFGPPGDKSMQSKYTVDNAGFGATGMRDEFGVFTGQRNDGFLGIFGEPTGRDYLDRMNEKVDELTDFFSGERKTLGGKKKEGTFKSVANFKERMENFDDMDEADKQALIDEMKAINGFYTKQFFAYKKNRIPIETKHKEFTEKVRQEKIQKELQAKIEKEQAKGKSLSQIGRENFTGEGQAFEKRKDTFTGGKTVKSASTPGGYYSSPRKDGGLINGYDDGGMVYLYDRKEMADGGEAESYEDIIDAYENGVGVLKGESLTDYIRRNKIKLMDPMGDLEKALFGKANGGRIGFRGGGAYQGGRSSTGRSSTSRGPAGGASAGGNYGGNRNPQQTYGGSIFRGGGGGGQTTTPTPTPTPTKNPFSKKNLQTHFANNQLLKNAVKKGILTNEEYNILGGYDATQTLDLGPIDTGLASLSYNIAQSVLGNQPFSDIPGDVARNITGAKKGGISPELQTKYENIIGQELADGGRVYLYDRQD
jgi:hypothetical protein